MGIYKKKVKNKDGKTVEYWTIRFQHHGKPYTESVGKVGEIKKSKVIRIHDERVRTIKMGRPDIIEIEKHPPTIEEFSEEYFDYVKNVLRKRSWQRDKLSLYHLKRYFGKYTLNVITPKDLMKFQSKRLDEGVRPATVNRELGCLKHLFNVAKRSGKFIGDNPVSQVKFLEENNQIERILTPEEEVKLLANSPPHLQPIIVTALHTGLRKSEILHLKWCDVDLVNGVIKIEATNTKSKKTRRIPLLFCLWSRSCCSLPLSSPLPYQ